MDPLTIFMLVSLAASAISSATAAKPKAPVLPPVPQASKAPTVQGMQKTALGPGPAQTFLTGAGGVDPSTLKLSKPSLLGA